MSVISLIKSAAVKAINTLYQVSLNEADIQVNATKAEFEGEYTIVLFAFVKQLKKSPEILGNELGNYLLTNNTSLFYSFNVIKGFLNLLYCEDYWNSFLYRQYANHCLEYKRQRIKG
jgi:arginyl-tRNA synthetase